MGVVGKSHVPGIAAGWDAPARSREAALATALQEPTVSWLPTLGGGVLGIGTAVGLARSRTARRVAGAGMLALGGAAAWLVVALRDRLDYFERSQRTEAASRSAAGGGSGAPGVHS